MPRYFNVTMSGSRDALYAVRAWCFKPVQEYGCSVFRMQHALPAPVFTFEKINTLEAIALELVSDDYESFNCLPWLFQRYPEAESFEAAKNAFSTDMPRLMVNAKRALADRAELGFIDAASWKLAKWGAAKDIEMSGPVSDMYDLGDNTARIEFPFACVTFPGRFFNNVIGTFNGLSYSVRLDARDRAGFEDTTTPRSAALLAALSKAL